MEPLRKNTLTAGMLTLWHLSVVRQAWDVGWLWKQLLAEVSELGRRRAHGKHGTCSKTRAQGMQTCSHAARTLSCCWTHDTRQKTDNKQRACVHVHFFFFFFFYFILYKQIKTFMVHSLLDTSPSNLYCMFMWGEIEVHALQMHTLIYCSKK